MSGFYARAAQAQAEKAEDLRRRNELGQRETELLRAWLRDVDSGKTHSMAEAMKRMERLVYMVRTGKEPVDDLVDHAKKDSRGSP